MSERPSSRITEGMLRVLSATCRTLAKFPTLPETHGLLYKIGILQNASVNICVVYNMDNVMLAK